METSKSKTFHASAQEAAQKVYNVISNSKKSEDKINENEGLLVLWDIESALLNGSTYKNSKLPRCIFIHVKLGN